MTHSNTRGDGEPVAPGVGQPRRRRSRIDRVEFAQLQSFSSSGEDLQAHRRLSPRRPAAVAGAAGAGRSCPDWLGDQPRLVGTAHGTPARPSTRIGRRPVRDLLELLRQQHSLASATATGPRSAHLSSSTPAPAISSRCCSTRSASSQLAVVAGGSLRRHRRPRGRLLARPQQYRCVLPIAAPAATSHHSRIETAFPLRLIELFATTDTLSHELAMTTPVDKAKASRSNSDAGRSRTERINRRLPHLQGASSSTGSTTRRHLLAGAIDRHDIGVGSRDTGRGPRAARRGRVPDVDRAQELDGDILYGPIRSSASSKCGAGRGPRGRYRPLRSNKGHDAFLVEWPQLTEVVQDLLP